MCLYLENRLESWLEDVKYLDFEKYTISYLLVLVLVLVLDLVLVFHLHLLGYLPYPTVYIYTNTKKVDSSNQIKFFR